MPILDKRIEDEVNVRTVTLPNEEPADKGDREVAPFPGPKPPRGPVGPTWGPNPADKKEPSWVRTPSVDGDKDRDRETGWKPLPGFPNHVTLASTGAMRGKPYPPQSERERKQRGEARQHDKTHYRKNRREVLRRSKIWYDKYKRTPMLKKDKKRRRDKPKKFERLPGGWESHSDKEKARRKQEKQASRRVVARLLANHAVRAMRAEVELDLVARVLAARRFPWYQAAASRREDVDRGQAAFLTARGRVGVVRRFGVGLVTYELLRAGRWHSRQALLSSFLREALPLSGMDLRAILAGVGARRADYSMIWRPDRSQQDAAPENRNWRVYPEEELPAPWTDPGFGDLPDLDGPWRVNPEFTDLPHKRPRSAAVDGLEEAVRRVAPDVARRATRLRVRKGPKDSRGVQRFTVQSSGGDPRAVEVMRVGPAWTRVRCSCPAWVYQGCEYHARRGGYLLGHPRGPATPPRVRDPQGRHLVCKHVVAVLRWLRGHHTP